MSSQGSSTKPKQKSTPGPTAKRILIVEDSPVVGPFTADLLEELHSDCPAPNIAIGRQLIASEKIDAALLDVHIRGERVFPLCEALASRNVPFVLTSGYADWDMPDKWQTARDFRNPIRWARSRRRSRLCSAPPTEIRSYCWLSSRACRPSSGDRPSPIRRTRSAAAPPGSAAVSSWSPCRSRGRWRPKRRAR